MRLAKSLVKGILTYVPILNRYRKKGTGGTNSARYCYSVWLRHRSKIDNSLGWKPLKHVAELGPGDSLGIGLTALLTGVDKLSAFDVVEHTEPEKNIKVLHEINALLKKASPIPDNHEFPSCHPLLESYEFPNNLLSQNLDQRESIVTSIERSLNRENNDTMVEYCPTWQSEVVASNGSLDLIYSQAVLEHVDDIEGLYESCAKWLKPGGLMSHDIDFSSHGITSAWDGYRAIPVWMWSIIRGKRPYMINRVPLSTHIHLLEKNGFEILLKEVKAERSCLPREKLAKQFSDLTEDDRSASGVYILAKKI